jgi:hypothetical protein
MSDTEFEKMVTEHFAKASWADTKVTVEDGILFQKLETANYIYFIATVRPLRATARLHNSFKTAQEREQAIMEVKKELKYRLSPGAAR